MKTFGLEGMRILVTGAAGLLGQRVVSALAEEKAFVIGIDVVKSPTSDILDISDPEDIDRYISNPLNKFNEGIDCLVNNAAVCFKGRNLSYKRDMKTLDVNVFGTSNMIDKFSPLMPDSGSIVNVASIYGILSPDFRIYEDNPEWYNSISYGASKAAIIQLTKYYAALLAPKRINSVSPGGIFNNHDKGFSDKYSDRVPLKRMADPEEIVNSVLFMLSPLSGYITGHNLVVDGGLSVW